MRHSLLSVLVILTSACVAEVDVPTETTVSSSSTGEGGATVSVSPDPTVTQVPSLPDPSECSEHSECDDQDYCDDQGVCVPEDTNNCEVDGEILDCTVDHGYEQAPPPEVMRCCDSGGYHECGAVFDCNVVGD